MNCMNILIVDDNIIKANDSKKCLVDIFPGANIHIVHTGEEALNALMRKSGIKYDLMVLDMEFCFSKNENIDRKCGLKLLDFINFNNSAFEKDDSKYIDNTIPIIVCSSGTYIKELDDYDNVKGFIRYGGQDLTSQYTNLVSLIRKKG